MKALGFAATADEIRPEQRSDLLLKTTAPSRLQAIANALNVCFGAAIQKGAKPEQIEDAWHRYTTSKAYKNLRIVEVSVEPLEPDELADTGFAPKIVA